MAAPSLLPVARSLAILCVLTTPFLLPPSAVAQDPPDAATHKAWMNDASDAQEDFRFAVSDKDAKAAAEALAKIDVLMQKTEAYWTARRANDGVALAKEARTGASQGATAARRGDMSGAADAFAKMSATCNTCHELHLEKR